jgi:hypothetical protein
MGYENIGVATTINTERVKRINARSKGRRGEQEVATMLRAVVTEAYAEMGLEPQLEIKRNQMQTAGKSRSEGQGDLVGLDWLAIEVKRVESDLPSSRNSWWEQAKSQAARSQTPILFSRMNDREWNVRTYVLTSVGRKQIKLPVDMAWSIFRIWLKEMIKERHMQSL